MPELPLSKFRVVEIGSGDALAYCGKLFADFGAEVIKIEPPGGDPARKIAPLADAGDGHRESGTFAWLNTNKRSITADLDKPADVERVRALLTDADLLLDARHPTAIAASALSHRRPAEQPNPGSRSPRSPGSANMVPIATMQQRIRCAAALQVW